ncbi:hypothetical protein D3C76_1044560 [compost metagenome]
MTVNGPVADVSLASTLMVNGVPGTALALSATVCGSCSIGPVGATPMTVTGSVSAPPADDLMVMLAGGCARSLTTSCWLIPDLDRRPKPWATRSGTSTSSLDDAWMVNRWLSQS